ncbi:hypothetical protein CR513_17915, partial [Mucuna pruriens]
MDIGKGFIKLPTKFSLKLAKFTTIDFLTSSTLFRGLVNQLNYKDVKKCYNLQTAISHNVKKIASSYIETLEALDNVLARNLMNVFASMIVLLTNLKIKYQMV